MGLRRQGDGLATFCDPGADKPLLEVATIQCRHCGGHWIPKPSSGRVRGWCMKCGGPVCGPKCEECVPHEKQMDLEEAGLRFEQAPVKIIVPGGVPGE